MAGFWRQVFQNNVILAEQIQTHDEPVTSPLCPSPPRALLPSSNRSVGGRGEAGAGSQLRPHRYRTVGPARGLC